MKKILLLLLALLTIAIPQSGAAEKESFIAKVIADQDEYAAFVKARDSKDGLEKAGLMEEFISDYPDSVLTVNALEYALMAYQQAGLYDKVEQTAEEILQVEHGNLFVLSTLTYIQRVKSSKGDHDAAQNAQSNGKKGLKALAGWKKPSELSEAAYEKQRAQMTATFAGAAAYGAQKENDLASARKYYLMAVKAAPDSLADYYQLAVTCLDTPVPDTNGFWYLARAHYLAKVQKNDSTRQKIAKNGRARYHKYHGSDEGWEQLLAAAEQQTEPPAGFIVNSSPSACELAVKIVRETDLVMLTFTDWKKVLSQRDCSTDAGLAAQKVWQYIKEQQNNDTRLVIPAKVVSAVGSTIIAAITQEGRHKNKGELHVSLASQPQTLPAVNDDVDIVGIISEYMPEPFLIKMTAAEIR